MSEQKHPAHRSTSIVALPKVSVKGIESALKTFHADTGQSPTQIGLTSVDFATIDKAINGHAGSRQPCVVTNPANSTLVTISAWTTGVTSGNAAMTGFGNER
ncbi:MAG TPA: hypothetical protein VHV10_14900 [Ktedonobacteraceae bacterium]|nr:hypothetical protein [Ktedonobacteraceae bacterium]